MLDRLFKSFLCRLTRLFRVGGSTASPYVMTIMFGPVQGFIASARRTRDLWFGSYILSQVSKAGARGLLAAVRSDSSSADPLATEVVLVFPHSNKPDDDFREDSDSKVVNKLVAIVTTDDPENLAKAVKRAAITGFKDLANDCLKKFGKENVDRDRWDQQKHDVVECYAAWAPLTPNLSDYGSKLRRANILLNARKALRDFIPAATAPDGAQGFGIPKSSLDGARESVLHKRTSNDVRTRFDIDPNEHLDCPGVVKRVLGKREKFAAVTRIAAEPWVQYLLKKNGEGFKKVEEAYGILERNGLATPAQSYGRLRYDAQFVHPERRRTKIGKSDTLEEHRALLRELRSKIAGCDPKRPPTKPIPYVVLLQADGDNMGALIHHIEDVRGHRQVATALAIFAREVHALVGKHGGQCVYAGGEDILALLPTNGAIGCAAELVEKFAERLSAANAVKKLVSDKKIDAPTLSVGLGIGHIMEPLSELRALAKEAEKLAKEGAHKLDRKRNALGIVIKPRSGAPLKYRDNWGEPASPQLFARRLQLWIDAFQEDILPDRLAYQAAQLSRLIPDKSSDALYGELVRLVKRKERSEPCANRETQEAATKCLAVCLGAAPATQCIPGRFIGPAALETEWLIARWFAKHIFVEPRLLTSAGTAAEPAHAR